MIKRLILFITLTMLLMGMTSCFGEGGGNSGNLAATIVREGTGDLIPGVVMIIGRQLKSPTVPDQMVFGDGMGKIQMTLLEGKYNVQLGTSVNGPFYTWPQTVQITAGYTTVVLFELPAGF
ncbi:MAG TPA: hypothetical protein ENN67_04590 [Firmicutes bacterium]|nr:hypothetical protein [Bacillota bacterium]